MRTPRAKIDTAIMIEPKILLFYIFTPLNDPDAVRLWQMTLCESLGLKGRIIISPHGLNGTIGGPLAAVKKYVRKTKEFAPFKNIDFKWSEGTGQDFPRLTVKVRDEIVSFGVADEIVVNENGIVGGGVHLSPTEVHELVEQRGNDVVFFDGRNSYEAQIGRFKNAVVPDVPTTPHFIAELESGKYDHLKDKPIVTYCTGGIRCEVLSMVLRNRGFEEVYQIAGGIVRYGEQFRDTGLWEGSLYVFDNRMNVEFSDEAKTLGRCQACSRPTHKYYNCINLECRQLTLTCDECASDAVSIECERCSAS